MGNGVGKVCLCSTGAGDISLRHDNNVGFLSNQYGNSICYVRPDPCRFSPFSDVFSDDDVTYMTFRSVSGASVSANSSTTPSNFLANTVQHSSVLDSKASFESSTSFTPVAPLQHCSASRGSSVSSPMERSFFSSGPVVNGYGLLSSPFDNQGLNSKGSDPVKLQRSSSHNDYVFQSEPDKRSFKKILKRAISCAISRGNRGSKNNEIANGTMGGEDANLNGDFSLHNVDDNTYLDDGCGDSVMGSENFHWAQGKAGEDRVHIVISEDQEWVFVGIYDGFNGPDATDYLLNNLFYAVHDELKGLLYNHNHKSESMANSVMVDGACSSSFNKENYPIGNEKLNSDSNGVRVKWEKSEGHGEQLGLEKGMQSKLNLADGKSFGHSDVLFALSEALRKTEEAFLKHVDEMITHNPVLAMMGSCVLAMVMKGEDVYLMNVGDSRAVLATQNGNSLQLTMDHSTHAKKEVHRIRREHPDDPYAVTKGRVKGFLNVTRAFGAGFLKQPKQNNAVLETFKVNYIGDSPYITCSPSLHHHRLSPNDRFLILSSDGLHQYFTNQEAVAKVESFMTCFPDRDPAQLLVEEALFRAAKKAGMDFNELLEIPQGERRLYHDDISIVIISLEGKIWRSSV